jgi:lipid II:glycine glycyltransferase (peptidoglycan interpeptide bridge formation enzyme)
MEARKGRRIYNRRCSSYERLAELARSYRCCRVYLVRAGERLVQGIMVVRDGSTAHYVIGAVDVAALDRAVSPACLLHWVAMRDFYREGVRYYSLGNDNRGGLQIFKNKFRPRRFEYPPIRTVVINPGLYRIWKFVAGRFFSEPLSDEPSAVEVPDHRPASS